MGLDFLSFGLLAQQNLGRWPNLSYFLAACAGPASTLGPPSRLWQRPCPAACGICQRFASRAGPFHRQGFFNLHWPLLLRYSGYFWSWLGLANVCLSGGLQAYGLMGLWAWVSLEA